MEPSMEYSMESSRRLRHCSGARNASINVHRLVLDLFRDQTQLASFFIFLVSFFLVSFGFSSSRTQTCRYPFEPPQREISNGTFHMPGACLTPCLHPCVHTCVQTCLHACLYTHCRGQLWGRGQSHRWQRPSSQNRAPKIELAKSQQFYILLLIYAWHAPHRRKPHSELAQCYAVSIR